MERLFSTKQVTDVLGYQGGEVSCLCPALELVCAPMQTAVECVWRTLAAPGFWRGFAGGEAGEEGCAVSLFTLFRPAAALPGAQEL